MIRVTHLPALALFLTLFCVAQASRAEVAVGDKPQFETKATDGTPITSESLRGKIVLIDFWATWCGPCVREAPHMVKIHKEYGEKGLRILGVSLDDDQGALLKMAPELGFDWPQIMDKKTGASLAAQFGVSGIPHVALLAPDGTVLFKNHPQAGLDQAIAEAFAKHPPSMIDAKALAEVKKALEKTEALIGDNKQADAIKLFAKIPAAARQEPSVSKKIAELQKGLEEYADQALAEAEEAIEKKEFGAGITKLRDLSKLTGLPAAKKATDRLKAVLNMPEAKAALAEAEKADKEKERAAKADELLEAAKKQQEAKKHEQAFAQFKLVAQQYPGTEAAKTAAAEVKKYESDPAFVKKANEAAASGKAKGMMSMANSYKSAGRTDLAKQKYQQIIAEFPGTSFAEQAKKELKDLK